MLRHFKTIPNQLTAIRLLLLPVLWAFAVMNMPFYVGVGMLIAAFTDAVDGFAARRLSQVSDFGARIDSLADNVLIPSAVVWLLMLRPEVFTEHPVVFLAGILLYASSIGVGLVKHRRLANLHLYMSKIAGAVEYLFIVHTFLSRSYHTALFYFAFGLFMLSSTETLVLQLTQPVVDEHMGSIVLVLLEHKCISRESTLGH